MNILGIIIDTNILIEIERNNKSIFLKLEKLDLVKDNLYITSPTYSEFYFGLLQSGKEEINQVANRLDKYKLLNTSKNSLIILAEIKHKITKAGKMIPIFDLLIASIAMDSGIPLVTLDVHFKNIPNLSVILLK